MIRLLSCRHNLMGIIIIFSVIMRHLENWWPSHHAVANIQMNHYHTNLSREINWGCATATKKCESDRESVWNWQQTHRKSDTCLIFLYAAVAVKLTVRLTFGQHSNFRLTNSVSIAVSLSNVSISVSLFIGWEGLSNSRQTYYSLYLQLFSRFLSVAILTH